MEEQTPWKGYCFRSKGNETTRELSSFDKTNTIPIPYQNSEHQPYKVTITHVANSGKVTMKANCDGSLVIGSNNNAEYSWASAEQTLLLGCYQKIDGVKGRFWKGTIYDFTIHEKVLSDAEIYDYLSVEYNDTYDLQSEIVFDGTYGIDTGIRLFDEPKDFTLFLHADTSQENGLDIPVFHCMYEKTPYKGLSYQVASGLNSYKIAGNFEYPAGAYSTTYQEKNESVKTCIVCKNGIITKIKCKTGINGEINDLVVTTNSYSKVEQSLMLGCYQTITGERGRFWKGTIYDFKVYNRALSDEETTALFE